MADLGVGVIGVGPQAPQQADKLIEDGYPYTLLLDPDHNLGQALGVGRQSLARYIFNLRAWWRWLGAFLTHRRQGKFTGHHSNLPCTALTDANAQVVWRYHGTGVGDHPQLRVVMREAQRLAGA